MATETCPRGVVERSTSLLSGGSALIDTVMTYFEQGFSPEAAARLLFVHPNTVRYRLRRVSG
jgi:DNA-binding PucR family transcriptional regulator